MVRAGTTSAAAGTGFGSGGYGAGGYGGGSDWPVERADRLQFAGVGLGSDLVVVADLGTDVAAYDTAGTLSWTRSRRGSLVGSTPAVVDGTVSVGSGAGGLYALSATDGTVLWRFDTGSAVVSSPAVDGGTAFVGSNAGVVHAVDAAGGTGEWTADVGGAVYCRPAVGTDAVVVTTADAVAVAVSRSDGSELWRTPVPGAAGGGSPTLASGLAIVAGDDLLALDAGTGAAQWSATTAGAPDATPAVAGGTAFVGDTGGVVHAVDVGTGSRLWSRDVGSPVEAAVVVADGTVYAGTTDGSLVALDAATGTETARWSVGGRVGSLTAGSGVVYVGRWDGVVERVTVG